MIQRLQAIRKRGFNLIEAAIVLGVVGLVIGGIWYAASSVMEKQKQNAVLDMMTLAVNKMKNALREVPLDYYTEGEDFNSLAVGIGALPKNLETPYGPIWAAYDIEGKPGIAFKLFNLSSGACIALTSRFSNDAETYGLSRLSFYDQTYHLYETFPINQDLIIQNCKDPNLVYVVMQFPWR